MYIATHKPLEPLRDDRKQVLCCEVLRIYIGSLKEDSVRSFGHMSLELQYIIDNVQEA